MSNFSVKQIEIAAKEKKVAVCAIGRLENQYAREFVEWYKKLGFDKGPVCFRPPQNWGPARPDG